MIIMIHHHTHTFASRTSESLEEVWLAWHSRHRSPILLRQIAQQSTCRSQLHRATAFHFLTVKVRSLDLLSISWIGEEEEEGAGAALALALVLALALSLSPPWPVDIDVLILLPVRFHLPLVTLSIHSLLSGQEEGW
jgi:hypothetical protein